MTAYRCEECKEHKHLYDSGLDPIDYERMICTECYDKREKEKK